MPTLAENHQVWNEMHGWPQAGDEWSVDWGGAKMQWHATLLPRLHAYVPAKTILEIAPGHGRWTQFLHPLCRRLVVVDLSERCIAACRTRFSSVGNIEYHVNDGTSLACVEDRSIDFVFSFDSLVHAEEDVIAAYLQELSRKLQPNGIGFIHHSNLGAHQTYLKLLSASGIARLPYRIRDLLDRSGLAELQDDKWRARTMTAEKFEVLANKVGLNCMSQELINWNSRRLIDCISVFTPKSAVKKKMLRNPNFMQEVRNAAKLSSIYSDGHQSETL